MQSEKTEFLVPASTPVMYEVYFSLPHFGSVRVWHVCLLTCGTAVLTSTRLLAAMSKHIRKVQVQTTVALSSSTGLSLRLLHLFINHLIK